ncbi:hypothetical protein [Bifidobacterium pseudocatenulatum]|uniref:hypothetical protein n=1 Tax=Bifidobacterium pseudocatenulatum TaxID=28026 RepID=UPI0022E55853|nr:hypothetical protein [Bifidobacterium pseudocatenulatum]
MSGTQAKASPSDIRISNITAAFEQLFPATQMSRANIGKLIGLSRFTTSEVTGEMVDNRILRELGPDNREGRGKRSQVLAIDTDFWRIVSVRPVESDARQRSAGGSFRQNRGPHRASRRPWLQRR